MSYNLEKHIAISKAAAKANKAKGNKHVQLISSLYQDQYRFLEELLQNAEDACRIRHGNDKGQIVFQLTKNELIVCHNGKLFDEKDLIAITTIGNTTKHDNPDVNLIGKFGFGFKSVFSVCHQPHIHSGKHHYKIVDFEVLETITPYKHPDFDTCFILPLSEKTDVFNNISSGLKSISYEKLLFLSSLSNITIQLPDETIRLNKTILHTYSKHLSIVSIQKQSKQSQLHSFLLYQPQQFSAKSDIGFAFRTIVGNEANILQYIEEYQTNVFVYFPTSESSGLQFHIHARFTTTPTREHIPFDTNATPENYKILKDIELAAANLLPELKKHAILQSSFFSLLPIFQQTEAQKYRIQESIAKGIYKTIETKAVLPTRNNTFTHISNLVFAQHRDIEELFSNTDIKTLFHKKYILDRDCIPKQYQENPYNIAWLKKMKIVDDKDVAAIIINKPEILKIKPIHWHIKFLIFIAQRTYLWSTDTADSYYNLRKTAFILCNNNTLCNPCSKDTPKLFLYSAGQRNIPMVHKEFMTHPTILSLFSMLGITSINSQELQVFQIVKNIIRYKDNPKKQKKYWLSLFSESINQTQTDLTHISNYISHSDCLPSIAYSKNGVSKCMKKLTEVHIQTTSLLHYFGSISEAICFVDYDFVLYLQNNAFSETDVFLFLHTLGVQTYLKPKETKAFAHDFLEECRTEFLKEVVTIKSEHIVNYTITGLSEWIVHPDLQSSVALLDIISNIPHAQFKGYIQIESFTQQKQFFFQPEYIDILLSSKWLFTNKLQPILPSELSSHQLHSAYFETTIRWDNLPTVFEQFSIFLNNRAYQQEQLLPYLSNANLSGLPSCIYEKIDINIETQKPMLIHLNVSNENITTASQHISVQTTELPANITLPLSFQNKEVDSFRALPQQTHAKKLILRLLINEFGNDPLFSIEEGLSLGDFVITQSEHLYAYVYVSALKIVTGSFVFIQPEQSELAKHPEAKHMYYAIDNITDEVPVIYKYERQGQTFSKLSTPFIYLKL